MRRCATSFFADASKGDKVVRWVAKPRIAQLPLGRLPNLATYNLIRAVSFLVPQ